MTISVENLDFFYESSLPVLENINFSVNKGDFIGIFGPNGGGKTTLLKILLGLLKPTRGIVKVLEKDPSEISDRLGYVPQVRRYDKSFPISVLEVVIQGCLSKYRGFGNYSETLKKKAHNALALVGLEEKANSPFGILSGGQIQRTLIARAIASDPEILFLDEATVGIDLKGLEQIMQFLLKLKGKITIILVTHDLQAIAKDMTQLFCIHRQLSAYTPEQICEHFAMGLYHPRLIDDLEKKDD